MQVSYFFSIILVSMASYLQGLHNPSEAVAGLLLHLLHFMFNPLLFIEFFPFADSNKRASLDMTNTHVNEGNNRYFNIVQKCCIPLTDRFRVSVMELHSRQLRSLSSL